MLQTLAFATLLCYTTFWEESWIIPQKFVLLDSAVILIPTYVLGLYNQENTDVRMTKIVESVKDNVEKQVKLVGWD